MAVRDSVALGEISEDLAGPGEHGARDLERPADEAQQREEALLGKVDPAGSAEEAHVHEEQRVHGGTIELVHGDKMNCEGW